MAAVGEEVELAVAVDVRLEHAVNADDFVLGNARLPRGGGLIFIRLLEPHDEAGLIARANEIHVSIAIDVESFAVDEGVILVIADDDFLPVGRDEQPRLAASIADDVDLAIAGEVGGYGDVVVQAFPHDVAFPVAFHRGGSRGEEEGLNEQDFQDVHDFIWCDFEFCRKGF